ncbi:MAG: acetyltransferase, partial [Actinomycetota bacterium]|nr:acetyltransferase [Actinomycetota bacterium]
MDVVTRSGDLVVRRMLDSKPDYKLMVGWRNQPHVRYWWDPDKAPLTLEEAIREYRPDTYSNAPTAACIVELGGRPIGFMQFYRLSSYAEEAAEVGVPFDERTWGIDIFIGESDEVGH